MDPLHDSSKLSTVVFVWETCQKFNKILGLQEFKLQTLINALFDKNESSLLENIHFGFIRTLMKDYAYIDVEGLYHTGLPVQLDLKKLNIITWPSFLLEFFRAVYGRKEVQSFEKKLRYRYTEKTIFKTKTQLYENFKLLCLNILATLVESKQFKKFVSSEYFNQDNYLCEVSDFYSKRSFISSLTDTEDSDKIVSSVVSNLLDAVVVASTSNDTQEFQVPETRRMIKEKYDLKKITKEIEESISKKTIFVKCREIVAKTREKFLMLLLKIKTFTKEEIQSYETLLESLDKYVEKEIMLFVETSEISKDPRMKLFANNSSFSPKIQDGIKMLIKIDEGHYTQLTTSEKIEFLNFLVHEVICCETIRTEINYISNELSSLKESLDDLEEEKELAMSRLNEDNESEIEAYRNLFYEIEAQRGNNEDDPLLGFPFVYKNEQSNVEYQGVVVKRLRYGMHRLQKTVKEYFVTDKGLTGDSVSISSKVNLTDAPMSDEDSMSISTASTGPPPGKLTSTYLKEQGLTPKSRNVFEFPTPRTLPSVKGKARILERELEADGIECMSDITAFDVISSVVCMNTTVIDANPELENIKYKCVLGNRDSCWITLRELCETGVLVPNFDANSEVLFPINILNFKTGKVPEALMIIGSQVFIRHFGFAVLLEHLENNLYKVKFSFGMGVVNAGAFISIFLPQYLFLEAYKNCKEMFNDSETSEKVESDFLKRKLELDAKVKLFEEKNSLNLMNFLCCTSNEFKFWLVDSIFIVEKQEKLEVLQHTEVEEFIRRNEKILTAECVAILLAKVDESELTTTSVDHYLYMIDENEKECKNVPPVINDLTVFPCWQKYSGTSFVQHNIRRLYESLSFLLTNNDRAIISQLLTPNYPQFYDKSTFDSCCEVLVMIESAVLNALNKFNFSFQAESQTEKPKSNFACFQYFGISIVLPPVRADFPFDTSKIFYLKTLTRKENGERLSRAEKDRVEQFFAALLSNFFERLGEKKGFKWQVSTLEMKGLISILFSNGFEELESKMFQKYRSNLEDQYSNTLYQYLLQVDTKTILNSKVETLGLTVGEISVVRFYTEWLPIRNCWLQTLERNKTKQLDLTTLLRCFHLLDQTIVLLEINVTQNTQDYGLKVGDSVIYDKLRHEASLTAMESKNTNEDSSAFLSWLGVLPDVVMLEDSNQIMRTRGNQGYYVASRVKEFEVYYLKKRFWNNALYYVVSVGPLSKNFQKRQTILERSKFSSYLTPKIKGKSQLESYLVSEKFCYLCLKGGLLVRCDVKNCLFSFHLTCLRFVKLYTSDIAQTLFCCPIHETLYKEVDFSAKTELVMFINSAFLIAIDSILQPNCKHANISGALVLPFTQEGSSNNFFEKMEPYGSLGSLRILCLRNHFKNESNVLDAIQMFLKHAHFATTSKYPTIHEMARIVASEIKKSFVLSLKRLLDLAKQNIKPKKRRVVGVKRKIVLKEPVVSKAALVQNSKPKTIAVTLSPSPLKQETEVTSRRSTRRKTKTKRIEVATGNSFSRPKRSKTSVSVKQSAMIARLQSTLHTPIKLNGVCSGCTNCVLRAQNSEKSFARIIETSCLRLSERERRSSYGTTSTANPLNFRYCGMFMYATEFRASLLRSNNIRSLSLFWSMKPRAGVESEEESVHTFVIPAKISPSMFLGTRKQWKLNSSLEE